MTVQQLDKTPPSYTPDLQALKDSNIMTSAVRKLFRNNWRKVSDVNINNVAKYEEWNVNSAKRQSFRKCVANLMLEFYGCQKREFWFVSEIKERYWISDSVIEFVNAYGNVGKATVDHSKQYTWDWTWMDNPPEMTQVNELQNKIEVDDASIEVNYQKDIKKRVWELTIELLDAKTDKEKADLEDAINKLKFILSPSSK